jgi:AraC-like DNA-binding protein
MDPAPQPLLRRFPAVRTNDPDEIREWLRPLFAISDVDLPQAGRQFECVLNHCRLPGLSLVYGRYGSPFTARLEQADFYMQGFPLSGAGEVRWNRGVTQIDPAAGGIAAGPGTNATFCYDNRFSHLILRVSPAALTQRLSVLMDRPVNPPLQLTGKADPQGAAAQLRLLTFLAAELDRSDERLPELVLSELEDAALVNYLMANEHNYTGLLHGTPRAAAPWQVRRAVDYMEQHWDEPLTIDRLTQVTETSARSLFLLFKKTHGVSPMVYLHRTRLRHAREMLRAPGPGTSVTRVGFLCGFTNMGAFAMKYHAVFGERPSETLRNSQQ